MKYGDKKIYRFFLRITSFLLVIAFIFFPFKESLRLNFLSPNLLLFLVITLFLIILLGLGCTIINIVAKKILIFPNISYYLLYKIVYPVIHKLFSSQSKLYQQNANLLIRYNNTIQRKRIKKYLRQEILILLPHCLQNASCTFKITNDINNCHECGKCVIEDFKKLQKEFGVHIKVATGGTLARKIISDIKPKVIIAVACHRDLTEGIKDIEVIPVIGILNERPNGPCFNTTCDPQLVRKILKDLL